MAAGYSKTFACSVLLWFRDDLSTAQARAYWRGAHAQLVARTPGFREYRQHHFEVGEEGCFPAIDGVETKVRSERRIDGMPEVILDGLLAPLKGGKQNKLVFADEANVFRRTILYAGGPGDGRSYDLRTRGRASSRVVLLLRRRGGTEAKAFATFVNDTLAPALLRSDAVHELRTQIFRPWSEKQWPTPGVAHDNLPGDQFHASVIIGFPNDAQRDNFLGSGVGAEMAGPVRAHCVAVHGYRVEATYAYVVDGRVTLPQRELAAKPTIDPVMRRLPPAPERATQKQSTAPFPPADLIPLGGHGAEDVVADVNGHLICGLADGRIVRIDPATEVATTIGDTGGRPLGLEPLDTGEILVCDAQRGLLMLDPSSGNVTVLVDTVEDIPLRFCSNVAASRDGTYWFTESSSRFDLQDYTGAMLEHRPSGRLLRRDPDGSVTVLLDGLYFANGLTITEDEDALIFAETDGYTLSRYWLTGPRTGQRHTIADNLPGFVDNLSRCESGSFWAALPNARNANLDKAGTLPAWLRRLFWRLAPKPAPVVPGPTWVMRFTTEGALLQDFQSERADFFGATGAVEANGKLYLASVECDHLLRCDISKST